MYHSLRRLAGRARRFMESDHVEFTGAVLPASYLRFGGPEFRDDAYFLRSASQEAQRLQQDFQLDASTRMLEVGCGYGRLAIGLINQRVPLKIYHAIDVTRDAISWCSRHLTRQDARFRFHYINVYNERYNPAGQAQETQFRFPFDAAEFTQIYLYSVFSHMELEPIKRYLAEFQRVLAPGGRIFVTLFVQPDAPTMTVNPTDYVMDWSGPLHCVRYNQAFMEQLFAEHGFSIDQCNYEVETNRQTAYYLTKA